MKILFDTSVLVEIDRKNKEVLTLLKKCIERGDEFLISTITLAEILTGAYLRDDSRKSVFEAKRILGQFLWIEVTPEIAEKAAQYLALLISKGRIVEFQDVVIAATSFVSHAEYLLTLNKPHFIVLPDFKEKACTPGEFARLL